MAKLSQYIDKEHAVGHIECLERHFKRISDRLDLLGVAVTDLEGKRYTVFERVDIACTALVCVTSFKKRDSVLKTLRPPVNDPSDEEDPEEIMASIFAEEVVEKMTVEVDE